MHSRRSVNGARLELAALLERWTGKLVPRAFLGVVRNNVHAWVNRATRGELAEIQADLAAAAKRMRAELAKDRR